MGPDTSGDGRFVRSDDGVELFVRHLAAGRRQAVLTHGTGLHGAVFTPMCADLGGELSCHAVDLRLHGRSGRGEVGAWWPNFGRDVLAVTGDLGPGATVGLGHSLGASALVRAEISAPGTFSFLYLYEPPLFPPRLRAPVSFEYALARDALRRRDVFTSREEARTRYASKPPLDALDSEALWHYVTEGFEDLPGGGVRLRCRPEDEAAVFAHARVDDLFDLLGKLDCPVVLAYGARSPLYSAAFCEEVAENVPEAVIERFEDLGHFGPMERPNEVAAAILRHLP